LKSNFNIAMAKTVYPKRLISNLEKIGIFEFCCNCSIARRSKISQSDLFDNNGELIATAIPAAEASQFLDGSFNVLLCGKHHGSVHTELNDSKIEFKDNHAHAKRWITSMIEHKGDLVLNEDYHFAECGIYAIKIRDLIRKDYFFNRFNAKSESYEVELKVFTCHDPFILNFYHFKTRGLEKLKSDKNGLWEVINPPVNKIKKRTYKAIKDVVIDLAYDPYK